MNNLYFTLPIIKFSIKHCEVEVSFLDSSANIVNSLCTTHEQLRDSNLFYLGSLALRKWQDYYILDDVTPSNKYIAIPLGSHTDIAVYALIDQHEYEADSTKQYFNLYTSLYWIATQRSASLTYPNFSKLNEANMIEELQQLLTIIVRNVTKKQP